MAGGSPLSRQIDVQLATVLAAARPLAPLALPLLEARGCRLAAPVTAPWPLPPFSCAILEGYALRAADVAGGSLHDPARLTVADIVPAGFRASVAVEPGTAIRIGSGAPIPAGADAVVALAQTDSGMVEVAVNGPVLQGANIRWAGEDLPAGNVVVEDGALLGSREIALLAAVGRSRVQVHPRPRVVAISTGTELVEPGEDVTSGLMVDSVGFLLTAAAAEAGAMAFRTAPVADEHDALRGMLEDQLVRADLILATGGVAETAYETLRSVLSEIGAVEFKPISMAPALELGFGRLGQDAVPTFALPGSPVAAFVAFHLFVRPMIRRMLGLAEVRPPVSARLSEDVVSPLAARSHILGRLHRASAAPEPTVVPIQERGLVGLRLADCLIVVPEDVARVPAGRLVQVLALGDP